MVSRTIAGCRACGAPELVPVLDLGRLPLANGLLPPQDLDRPEPRFPLVVVRCPVCTLVQITETVAPEVLFREYLYFSSYSETMLQHARALVATVLARYPLGPRSLVVEVGSNDGYLLQFYRQAGVPVLGIDPAANIARVAEARGIPTLCAFFGADLAAALAAQGQRATVLHAHNVLAHVADLPGFVAGMRRLLADDGLAIIEVPYLGDLLDRGAFDTIYHEHLCYFSLTALDRLFGRHDLVIVDVERVPVHGGSLRLWLRPTPAAPGPAVRALLQAEADWVADPAVYQAFGARVQAVVARLRAVLGELRSQGARLAAYGAAAKGTVLLNVAGLGPAFLEYVVDRNPAKQGRYVPGVRLPVGPPAWLDERPPDYLLILPWNIAAEVMAQQAAYAARGGRFILPLPEVMVV